MAISDSSSSPNAVDDDYDKLWTEYIKKADKEDSRLFEDGKGVIDGLLIFIGLFSAILTAFIIQISDNFQPDPTEVTNKILIAIYNRTMNASTPIDLEQFLRLDDSSRRSNLTQNWLLHISLTLSIVVAAVAMAANLWLSRYRRDVNASLGPPRAVAKRRQELYDGFQAWKLQGCIDALPLMTLLAVFLFGFFINSFILEKQSDIAHVVARIFDLGIAFLLITSFSAAFIASPFKSPFSDFVKSVPQYLLGNPVGFFKPRRPVLWRRIGIVFFLIVSISAGVYFVMKGNFIYFFFLYFGAACVFALAPDGDELPRPPVIPDLVRHFNPILSLLAFLPVRLARFFGVPVPLGVPTQILLASIAIWTFATLSVHFSDISTPLTIAFLVMASVPLCWLGWRCIKLTKTPSAVVEAGAIWRLVKQDPDLFQNAAKMPGRSSFAHLVDEILTFKLLRSHSAPKDDVLTIAHLIVDILTKLLRSHSAPEDDVLSIAHLIVEIFTKLLRSHSAPEEDVLSIAHPVVEILTKRLRSHSAPEEDVSWHITSLATLLDLISPDAASLGRPVLPGGLPNGLVDKFGKCSHQKGNNQTTWKGGRERCPEKCVSDAVEYLQVSTKLEVAP